MNNSNGQPHQAAQQQSQAVHGITPEQVMNLPFLDAPRKEKYAHLVRGFHEMIRTRPAEHGDHINAKQKLAEFTQNCRNQLQKWKQQSAQQNAAQTSASQPNSSQVSAPQVQQSQQQQPSQQQHQQQPQPPLLQQQQQPQPPQTMNRVPQGPVQISASAWSIANKAHINLPSGVVAGTADADTYTKDERTRYAQALNSSEQSQSLLQKLRALIEQQKGTGAQLPAHVLQQVQAAEKRAQQSRQYIESFQAKHHAPPATQTPTNGQLQSNGSMTAANNVPNASQMNVGATPLPNIGLSASQSVMSPPNAQMPNQIPGPRPPTAQQSQMPGQPALQQPAPNQPRPLPNAQQQAQQNPVLNPQNPHSASLQSAPQPYSHQAAIDAANRSYSADANQQAQRPVQHPIPVQPARDSSTMTASGNTANSKPFPIPEQLNIPPPQPVSVGPGRPTMSGPAGGPPGMMGQAAIQQQQRYNLEGEGEHVLSKKKLDELVRQVTGGAEGSTDALTPEVEEAVLQMADNFIDDIVGAACKVAKLRNTATLEVRDLQLILERNYNIRIPGYSLDETRTVRKFQPAAGWTQKMNAIQAAKVMGGKMDL